MEKKFKKDIASLEQIFAFVEECLAAYHIDESNQLSVNLAVEEFFTNMVKYSPENNNDVAISISRNDKALVVSLLDTDVEPFDVTRSPEVDTLAPLHERKVGGLGIHLAKHLMDSVRYEYANRCSKITLVKMLEK